METSPSRHHTNLKEPLYVENNDNTEEMSIKLTDNIEAIIEAVQSLEGYEIRLGTKDDTRTLRKNMKGQIIEANQLVQKTKVLLSQFETLKPKRRDEVEYRNKILKRTKENFTKQNDKFTKVLRDIQNKEKIYLDVRKSFIKGDLTASTASTDLEVEVQQQTLDLDFTEAMIKERETDIQDIRRLAHEMNLTAQAQAHKLQESGEEIITIEENAKHAEIQTGNGNKELDKALKNQKKLSARNLLCLLLILVICGVVVVFTVPGVLSSGSS